MKNIILEDNEDEKPEETAGEDTESKEGSEEENKDDGNADAGNDDSTEDSMSDEPFAGLDLRAAHCFGFKLPKSKSWTEIADQIDDLGAAHADLHQLEKSLTRDVEESYMKIAEFKLVNVDDNMAYYLWFDNNKSMWNVEILDSPEAEITFEERADFFKSEMFKKIAKKTYYRILDAYGKYNNNVKQLCDNGELLLVDAVKLDAILHFISLDYFMKNILEGKYLSY